MHFQKVLFVSNGLTDELDTLYCALKIINAAEDAMLNVLITCPEFPKDLYEYQVENENFLKEKITKTVDIAVSHLNLEPIKVNIKIKYGKRSDILIIDEVINYSYDMVIKAVEDNNKLPGFKALDMSLLRKCPVALLLVRNFENKPDINIKAAVDPLEDTINHNLAIKIIEYSNFLAKVFHAKFEIITCWQLLLENYMQDSLWFKVPPEELNEKLKTAKANHDAELNNLLSKIDHVNNYIVKSLKGIAAECIPEYLKRNKCDILVMGTVARTGISGFLIGNTAESIVQQITCSLLALKPMGFLVK